MQFTCSLHTIYMNLTRVLHISYMLSTCCLQAFHIILTRYIHVDYLLITCLLHIDYLHVTCRLHVITCVYRLLLNAVHVIACNACNRMLLHAIT